MFNDSSAVSNAITGINNDNVVSGYFTDKNGRTKGFVQSLVNGANVLHLVPGSTVTQFLGVNQANEVGFFNDSKGIPRTASSTIRRKTC